MRCFHCKKDFNVGDEILFYDEFLAPGETVAFCSHECVGRAMWMALGEVTLDDEMVCCDSPKDFHCILSEKEYLD